MALLAVSEIFNRVDDQRRDDGETPVDETKKIRAMNAILDILQAEANWLFAVRQKVVDYLNTYSDYAVANTLGITDLKDLKDLRLEDDYDGTFEYKEADEFALALGRRDSRRLMTLETRDADQILRINYWGQRPVATVHSATSYNDNGTWTADTSTSDATNVTTDTLEWTQGSVDFDVDVSQSVNNKATIYNATLTAVDLTDHLDVSHARMKVFIPSGLTATSFELRWGSDASNYWSQTVTAPATGGNFATNARNDLDFAWSSATKTGTPDESAIDYVSFTVNYAGTQTDVNGVKIQAINFIRPERLLLLYYTQYLSQTSAGVFQEKVTANTDLLLVPRAHKECLVEGVLWQVMDQMGSDDRQDAPKHKALFEADLKPLKKVHGVSPVPTRRRFKVKMFRET